MTSPSIARRAVHNRPPDDAAFGVRRMHDERGTVGKFDALARPNVVQMSGCGRCRPEFDHPDVIAAGGGEMDRDRLAAATPVDRGGQCR